MIMKYLQVAANLMSDKELLRTQQLTPTYRPFVDFLLDFSREQARALQAQCDHCSKDAVAMDPMTAI